MQVFIRKDRIDPLTLIAPQHIYPVRYQQSLPYQHRQGFITQASIKEKNVYHNVCVSFYRSATWFHVLE